MADGTPCGKTVRERCRHPVSGAWSLGTLLLITCLVVWTTMERFRDPVGEKYVYLVPPGGADFALAFNGARALWLGVNPYHNDVPALADYWKRDYLWATGREIRGVYPPTHFLLYLPLAALTADFRQASRFLFGLNIAALLLLAWVTWRLLVRIAGCSEEERRSSLVLIPLLFVVLTCNPGMSLALERGDGGDIAAAVFCWAAVLFCLDRRMFPAMFLMAPAALIKGYALGGWLGLALLGLGRTTWRSTLAGGVAGLAVFLLPVIRYVPDGVEVRREFWALTDRLDWIFLWWNHGFRNVYRQLAPDFEIGGWVVTTVYGGVLAALCWFKAWRSQVGGKAPETALMVVLFSTVAVAVMLGANPQSLVYNQVLVLPGILVIMLAAPILARACALPGWGLHVLGAVNLVTAFCLFKARWVDVHFLSLAGVGLILFLLTVGGVLSGEWWHRRRRAREATS